MNNTAPFNQTSSPSKFHQFIFSWWKSHKRDLPWRRTRDPYRILVSEVMLQQTQVHRVIPKYAEFIKSYPTVRDLAQASAADVIRIWKGMGYNRRALYLHRAAKIIVEQKRSKLPGVGKYTARAILVFAFNKNIALVDTNIRRIITHFFFNGKLQKEKVIQAVADQLLPRGKSWAWHQALMDYGAIALPRNRPERSRGTQVSFRESNRYYRGRVVDVLREGPKSDKELFAIAKRSIIDSLLRDGLIVRKEEIFMLPD